MPGHRRTHLAEWKLSRALGLGALIAGGLAMALALLVIAILVAPAVFWLSWNVLELGPAVGLPKLGFWGIMLATLFLVVGWFGKAAITGIVFLVDPSWFSGQALVSWPEPTLRNFLAVIMLAALAAMPHASHSAGKTKTA